MHNYRYSTQNSEFCCRQKLLFFPKVTGKAFFESIKGENEVEEKSSSNSKKKETIGVNFQKLETQVEDFVTCEPNVNVNYLLLTLVPILNDQLSQI